MKVKELVSKLLQMPQDLGIEITDEESGDQLPILRVVKEQIPDEEAVVVIYVEEPGGRPVARASARMDPIVCTTCNARSGEPCTQPTNNGRKAVSWHHLARKEVS